VIAENERGGAAGEKSPEPAQIPVHRLRRQESRLEIGGLFAEQEARELRQPLPPVRWFRKELIARRRHFPEAAGDIEMVLRLAPGAGDLLGVGVAGFLDDESFAREEIEQSPARRREAAKSRTQVTPR